MIVEEYSVTRAADLEPKPETMSKPQNAHIHGKDGEKFTVIGESASIRLARKIAEVGSIGGQ